MNTIFKNTNKIIILGLIKGLNSRVLSSTLATTRANEENIQTKLGINKTVRSLQNLLDVNYTTALGIVNDHLKLTERNEEFLSNNFKLLVNSGISPKTILKYPQLLGVPYLDENINDLKILPYPLNTIIVLACLDKPKLDRFIKEYSHQDDKISLVSKLLQVTPEEASELIYKKTFLISKDTQVVKNNLKILLDFGISLDEVRKDLYVLKYSHDLVKSRIDLIQDQCIKIDSPKPWMIRSPMRVIRNYVKRRTDTRNILGNDSRTEFLSKKLECSEKDAKYLIDKMPALSTKSVKTLSEIIDFLYDKGFQPYQIYRVPKVLVHSVETTKKRLELLDKAGVEVDSLYVLIKSQKQFVQYFESLVKGKRVN